MAIHKKNDEEEEEEEEEEEKEEKEEKEEEINHLGEWIRCDYFPFTFMLSVQSR